MKKDKKVIWETKPSQLIYLSEYIGYFFIVIISFIAEFYILPKYFEISFQYKFSYMTIPFFIGVAYIHHVILKYTTYTFTNERLIKRTGVLNKKLDNLELFRIKDMYLYKPFFLRIFGKGNIHLITSDFSHNKIKIEGIDNSKELFDKLLDIVEDRRKERGVRELDVN